MRQHIYYPTGKRALQPTRSERFRWRVIDTANFLVPALGALGFIFASQFYSSPALMAPGLVLGALLVLGVFKTGPF